MTFMNFHDFNFSYIKGEKQNYTNFFMKLQGHTTIFLII